MSNNVMQGNVENVKTTKLNDLPIGMISSHLNVRSVGSLRSTSKAIRNSATSPFLKPLSKLVNIDEVEMEDYAWQKNW
jgi:hypothetical protein